MTTVKTLDEHGHAATPFGIDGLGGPCSRGGASLTPSYRDFKPFGLLGLLASLGRNTAEDGRRIEDRIPPRIAVLAAARFCRYEPAVANAANHDHSVNAADYEKFVQAVGGFRISAQKKKAG
ncbi:MAG: hypothetical protein CMO80_16645 [Verrucomicrobiales bacterium]|nr:hypothetical protein [Verrucomicrobiales bacterium]|tara:strand:+ start:7958 stop:8323 length:366 start_codon:yes stop_codon:yes gene_type:complete